MRDNDRPAFSDKDRAAMRASVNYARKIPPGLGVPQDRAVFGWAMLRRMLTLRGLPKVCRERACRRVKFCVGPTIRCAHDFPLPPADPDKIGAAAAELHRAIKRRVDGFASERGSSSPRSRGEGP